MDSDDLARRLLRKVHDVCIDSTQWDELRNTKLLLQDEARHGADYAKYIRSFFFLLCTGERRQRTFFCATNGEHTFRNTAQEVLMAELRRTFPQGDHTGLDTDRLQLRTVELIRAASKLLVVDVVANGHLAGVDLEDAAARGLVRQGELDLAV